ncbi:unnamed protein product [Rotaria sp. Silwood1]|nr:unnamed protein product [Rotaria sp. Silwood1]CAF3831657.1 unnamed protein product [Rotaria sp. Silwood1]CAF4624509.1 unnamed protein product [Rotaria sp. Silwood1]CAF4690531.1 unnamed protein product [Rotaria sp. Silwood1]
MDLPSPNKSDSELTSLIRHRIETTFRLTLIEIECYSKLGIGLIRVKENETKDYLVKTIGRIALSPQDTSATILFTETLEYVSYVVLDTTNVKDEINWPKPEVISNRWAEVYSGEKPNSCEQVDVQFPNIYRIVSSSFDQLCEIMENQDFGIDNSPCARVYLGADCSYLENLSKSTTENQIRKAVSDAVGQINHISKLDLHIQLNKQTNNVCLISANIARKWATKTIYIEQEPISITENLTRYIYIHSDPRTYNDDDIIKQFNGKARKMKSRGNKLILEILDKKVFIECVKRKLIRIGDASLPLEIYTPFSDPEDCEIDADTWYKGEMLRCKADIMQFVPNREHKIFRLKWNSEIWLKEFRLVKDNNQNARKNDNSEQQGNMTPDQMRHRLRVTVMLNTIATIRKKSYMIKDREIKSNLNPKIQTIIYNHQSKLKPGGPMPLKETTYKKTDVEVVKKDCLVVYEHLVNQGKKPLLLNMASATSPGGGYRKGDGAQEENLFRRSDYLRSLDIGLDEYIDDPSERLHCTSTCDLDSCFDSRRMYPMDEYGAIYTSGLTVFRHPEFIEDKANEADGYAYMEKPLTEVCSLAMAAYRDPKLDGNMLAPKYAVGMRKKIENIFSIAYHHKHNCLVLSALGCGAFRNPPEHVAKIFRSVIEQYAGFFELIVFAIIDDHNTGQGLNKQGNFQPFYDELNGKTMKPFSPMNQPNTIFGPYRLLSDGRTIHDISICDVPPCNFGAKCNQMYDPKHAPNFSHPPMCLQQSLNGNCTQTGDIIHMSSFIHRKPCEYGAQCRDIDNKKHAEEFEHPFYCPNKGACQDTSDNHEREYRHLPLCKHAHKCVDFQKHIQPHCNSFRHYMPNCQHGPYCVEFHNKEHMNNYKHPFPTPCPWTPYNCSFSNELTHGKASHHARQHCLEYAHVCPFGRSCTTSNSWHWEKCIHVPRISCEFLDKCDKCNQEDHLNSFTHPKIRDIRLSCKYADKCHERQDLNHLSKYRHSMTFEDSGVVRYFNLNKDIDFLQNQNDNIKRVLDYAEMKKWKSFTLESIPKEIIYWIRTVQPVHRCSPEIFESIILHGHVMSLEYMDNLSKPKFVANSVLQHSRMQRIERLKITDCANHAKEYITALVTDIYEKADFPKKYDGDAIETHVDDAVQSANRAELIRRKGGILSAQLNNPNDMEAIHTKTKEIAEASMKLNLKKTGVGYKNDIKVGTNKTVFSILGPHTGYYYGDIVLVFKREILHHPDANFSLQAATSYVSGNCYDWRPWLGTRSESEQTRIELFHKSKLHASVPGYEYATALELIAITSHILHEKLAEIDLDKVIERWLKVDSHQTIEAHLPPLIPLDYIEHIYMPQSIYTKLNENTRTVVDDVFKGCTTYSDKESKKYTQFVVEKLVERFRPCNPHSVSRPTHGAVMTIPSTNFNDHYVLPLTITQANEQYRKKHPKLPKDSTIYIYWQLMNGDMMLTLSSEPIDAAESHGKDSCLICYIAPKPTFGSSNNIEYHEQTSYLNSGQPFQHSVFISERRYAGKSTGFFIGCNTDDVMTLCLEIQRSTGTVTLSHAGPNSIYNHEKISCKFSRTELDLNKLEFIHVSAGNRTVPIQNLIITFEKQADLHPTFDKDFDKNPFPAATASPTDQCTDNTQEHHHAQSAMTDDGQSSESPGFLTRMINKAGEMKDKMKDKVFGSDDTLSLKPCPDSINCFIQFSDNASTHNSQFSHPCCFGDLCRNPEPNLTHPNESHTVPKCSFDKTCKQLCDPIHRAQYCHTGLPYFLIPCRHQKRCKDNSESHRKKYSHGEEDLNAIAKAASKVGTVGSPQDGQQAQKQDNDSASLTPCKRGSQCRDIADVKHCEKFSHPPGVEKKDNRIPCQWGAKCHDHKKHHRTKYSHPSS